MVAWCAESRNCVDLERHDGFSLLVVYSGEE